MLNTKICLCFLTTLSAIAKSVWLLSGIEHKDLCFSLTSLNIFCQGTALSPNWRRTGMFDLRKICAVGISQNRVDNTPSYATATHTCTK